jgi:hypothetical protein
VLPKVEVDLPENGPIANALEDLLRGRGNRPVTASEACRMLADHFQLDSKQRNTRGSTRGEIVWDYRVRAAREHLARKKIMHREPWDSWALTDFYFDHPGGIAFDDDVGSDVEF